MTLNMGANRQSLKAKQTPPGYDRSGDRPEGHPTWDSISNRRSSDQTVASPVCLICRRRRPEPQFRGSLRMRFLEPVPVPLFESLLPGLQPAWLRRILELLAGPLVLEILLNHHVQLSVCRQLCVARRLLSRLLPDFISRPLLYSSAGSPAMSIEHRHAA